MNLKHSANEWTEVVYGRLWFQGKKKLIDLYEIDVAKLKHKTHDPYTVLVGTTNHPCAVISISQQTIGISFLDEDLNDISSCSYEVLSYDSIVLSTASVRIYQPKSSTVESGLSFSFNDKSFWIRQEHFYPEHSLKLNQYKTDEAPPVISYPQFGAYKDLIEHSIKILTKAISWEQENLIPLDE